MNIAEMWGIGLKQAKATMQCTTQRGARSAIMPLSCHYRADQMCNLHHLNSKFAADTFYADTKSLNQNTCAQIYSHKTGFTAVYPMEKLQEIELDKCTKTLVMILACQNI
jgi:hypothetical protein